MPVEKVKCAGTCGKTHSVYFPEDSKIDSKNWYCSSCRDVKFNGLLRAMGYKVK